MHQFSPGAGVVHGHPLCCRRTCRRTRCCTAAALQRRAAVLSVRHRRPTPSPAWFWCFSRAPAVPPPRHGVAPPPHHGVAQYPLYKAANARLPTDVPFPCYTHVVSVLHVSRALHMSTTYHASLRVWCTCTARLFGSIHGVCCLDHVPWAAPLLHLWCGCTPCVVMQTYICVGVCHPVLCGCVSHTSDTLPTYLTCFVRVSLASPVSGSTCVHVFHPCCVCLSGRARCYPPKTQGDVTRGTYHLLGPAQGEHTTGQVHGAFMLKSQGDSPLSES